jgi:hypothetical protein
VTSATIETTTPTYSWTTVVGSLTSVGGLIIMAVCIYASVSHRTEAGFAPIPNGLAALACAMTLGGLVLVLFRILHADREEMMRRLEVMDKKLNNVWGIAATTSLEAQPFHPQTEKPAQQKHTQRRGRRRRNRLDDAESASAASVSQLPSADVLREVRGLAKRVISSERRRIEDNFEDRKPI